MRERAWGKIRASSKLCSANNFTVWVVDFSSRQLYWSGEMDFHLATCKWGAKRLIHIQILPIISCIGNNLFCFCFGIWRISNSYWKLKLGWQNLKQDLVSILLWNSNFEFSTRVKFILTCPALWQETSNFSQNQNIGSYSQWILSLCRF